MLRKMLRKDEAGFTLIELLIVVVIIGILAAVGVPIYSRYVNTARASEAPTIITAIVEYAQSYARAHPTIVSGTTYANWGMLGTAEDSTDTTGWISEVVGTDNQYFNYYYTINCGAATGLSMGATPCIYAQGNGAFDFDAADFLVYSLDPTGAGDINTTWWSGTNRLEDIVPD